MACRVDDRRRSICQHHVERDDIIADEAVDTTNTTETAAKTWSHHADTVTRSGRGDIALVPQVSRDFAVVSSATKPGGLPAGLYLDAIQILHVNLDPFKSSEGLCPPVATIDGQEIDAVLVTVSDLCVVSQWSIQATGHTTYNGRNVRLFCWSNNDLYLRPFKVGPSSRGIRVTRVITPKDDRARGHLGSQFLPDLARSQLSPTQRQSLKIRRDGSCVS